MTIQYKNAGINLSGTGTVSVLTSPTSARCLIKQIQVDNSSANPVNLSVQVTDSSADHRKMAKQKFTHFIPRDKPKKRPRRHCKTLNKKKKLQNNKKYNRQGRRQK